jgi:hypothetical protein
VTSRETVVVFLGPSLPVTEAQCLLPGAMILPPARQGDVYRVVRDYRPRRIGLVDGTFASVPAVWHREILWAVAEAGVRVYGAASMGALRAAELDVYGMIGIGKIYDSYRLGRYVPFTDPFEDDDEVAVVHGPPEMISLPASFAMVDVRETLATAEAVGLIDSAIRDRLATTLKRIYFPDRSISRLAEAAAALPEAEGGTLVAWLRAGNAVSQKWRDAAALLRRLADPDEVASPPTFVFERVQLWEHFRTAADLADLGLPARAAAE